MASSCMIFPEALPQRVRQEPKLSAEVRMYDLLKEFMAAKRSKDNGEANEAMPNTLVLSCYAVPDSLNV